MLTTRQIYELNQLSDQEDFSRVITKINCNGLPVGTPFIMRNSDLAVTTAERDYGIIIMNPCPVGQDYRCNTLAEVAAEAVTVTSEPSFLHLHYTKVSSDASVTEDFTEAFNHALAGGAATVFFKDVPAANKVLCNLIPEFAVKFKYNGMLRTNALSSSEKTEKTVLMVQYFHPKHCCAIYYTDKVDGVIMSISMIMPEISAAKNAVIRPMYMSLFISNYLDNIVSLDGTKITSITPLICNYYHKFVNDCGSSMVSAAKPIKKQTPIAEKRRAMDALADRIGVSRTPNLTKTGTIDAADVHSLSGKKSVFTVSTSGASLDTLNTSFAAAGIDTNINAESVDNTHKPAYSQFKDEVKGSRDATGITYYKDVVDAPAPEMDMDWEYIRKKSTRWAMEAFSLPTSKSAVEEVANFFDGDDDSAYPTSPSLKKPKVKGKKETYTVAVPPPKVVNDLDI
ncbi:MAG TPA: hypothetical protein VI911_01075 [Patescibacteria group bacterium]|nr:hypothetical protein [Patescibacteria group bacterium]